MILGLYNSNSHHTKVSEVTTSLTESMYRNSICDDPPSVWGVLTSSNFSSLSFKFITPTMCSVNTVTEETRFPWYTQHLKQNTSQEDQYFHHLNWWYCFQVRQRSSPPLFTFNYKWCIPSPSPESRTRIVEYSWLWPMSGTSWKYESFIGPLCRNVYTQHGSIWPRRKYGSIWPWRKYVCHGARLWWRMSDRDG